MFETPPRKILFEKYQKLNFEFSTVVVTKQDLSYGVVVGTLGLRSQDMSSNPRKSKLMLFR